MVRPGWVSTVIPMMPGSSATISSIFSCPAIIKDRTRRTTEVIITRALWRRSFLTRLR